MMSPFQLVLSKSKSVPPFAANPQGGQWMTALAMQHDGRHAKFAFILVRLSCATSFGSHVR
jgi:hypothetical protein